MIRYLDIIQEGLYLVDNIIQVSFDEELNAVAEWDEKLLTKAEVEEVVDDLFLVVAKRIKIMANNQK
jgi:hypothetical protein